jgi:hypothetical protein
MTEREKDALFGRIFATPVGRELCQKLGPDGAMTVKEIIARVIRMRAVWGDISSEGWPWE